MSPVKCGFLFWMLFFIAVNISAQKKNPVHQWQFHSINSIGLLEGQVGSAFQWQTINGVQYTSWFAGIGAGIDYYRFRSIPLFLDIRKTFGTAKNRFFVYGDIGIHANWITDKQKNGNGYIAVADISNGLYTDMGIGYAVNVVQQQTLLISAGYSGKTLKGTQIDYSPQVTDGPSGISKLQYNLNRLTIKLGWKF